MFAYVTGHRLLMTLIGIVSVIVYLNVRHRLPVAIRRPLWIVVMAQAIAGLVLPRSTSGWLMFFIVGVGLLSCWCS